MSKPNSNAEDKHDGTGSNCDSAADSSAHPVVGDEKPGRAKALIGSHLAAQIQASHGIISTIKQKARIWRLYRALGLF